MSKEITHPKTFISVDGRSKEGYWKSNMKIDPEYAQYYVALFEAMSAYPFPEEHPKKHEELAEFISKLKKIEESDKLNMVCCNGWSECRLCGKPNGTKEYLTDYVDWPEGLMHYYEEHNIIPSKEFYDFVMKFTL